MMCVCVCEIRTSDLCMDMLSSVEQKKKTNHYFGYLLIHMQRCLHGAEVLLCSVQQSCCVAGDLTSLVCFHSARLIIRSGIKRLRRAHLGISKSKFNSRVNKNGIKYKGVIAPNTKRDRAAIAGKRKWLHLCCR